MFELAPSELPAPNNDGDHRIKRPLMQPMEFSPTFIQV